MGYRREEREEKEDESEGVGAENRSLDDGWILAILGISGKISQLASEPRPLDFESSALPTTPLMRAVFNLYVCTQIDANKNAA